MSGSRLGRGRVGRLALLAFVTVVVIIMVFVYKTTTSEMAKLRDLHIKCAQQQEALAAQLQVIYEYKVQLEKTLSNEKSANAAAKEELQQKASRERSLRDKDSLEANQRFNALQQNYKLLQTEHQDLKDDCKKKEEVALENVKNLEAILLELRQQQKKTADENKKSMENIKNKYLEIMQEKEQIEEKYNELKKNTDENNGFAEHLQKQVVQLQRELDESEKAVHYPSGVLKTAKSLLPRPENKASFDNDIDNNNVNENKAAASDNNVLQVIRPSTQHQASVSASNPVKLAAAPPPDRQAQSPSESSSISSNNVNNSNNIINNNNDNNNNNNNNNNNSKLTTKARLPQGVPPIPRLFESANKEDLRPLDKSGNKLPILRQPVGPELALGFAEHRKLPVGLEDTANEGEPIRRNEPNGPGNSGRFNGAEQKNSGRQMDAWYKLKAGVQEIGDPHHFEKSGFENAGANEDVEQYDDYNYKEPQNKNGDLHLEEGEDEREDEDDYMHNNVNVVKHE